MSDQDAEQRTVSVARDTNTVGQHLPDGRGAVRVHDLMNDCQDLRSMTVGMSPDAEMAEWRKLANEFYEPDAKIRTRLWNPDTGESRSYLISAELIPRYLRASFNDVGVRTKLTFPHAEETALENGDVVLNISHMAIIHQYLDNQKFRVDGRLCMHFSPRYKILFSDFTIIYYEDHDEQQESREKLPNAFNEYGVTHELMNYLEMAQIFSSLGDLMTITKLMNVSPSG
eukprot:TRINITY_DN4595_c0_g1_i4.p1 TRINITY_DN4595_c0_g1~~TRINITY_DN4595_c0_g1_i4.p1  ORF type:complete len:228 (+),score=53.49 TRINITY_DN4595_c0_g1_i4:55-738(+)